MAVRLSRSSVALVRIVIAAMLAILALAGASSPAQASDAWTTTADLSQPGQNAEAAQVVMSGNTVVAAWRRYDGSNWRAQAARSGDGGLTWSVPVDLSPSGQNAFDVQIAMSGSTVMVVWVGWNGSNWIVNVARSGDGGEAWGAPVGISDPQRSAYVPQIAMSGSTVVVAWGEGQAPDRYVYVARSTDGGVTWNGPNNLSVDGEDTERPRAAASGDYVLVGWSWSDKSTPFRVRVKRNTRDDGMFFRWGQDLTDAVGAALVQVEMSGSTALVAWTEPSGQDRTLKVARSTDAGETWGAAVDVAGAPPQFSAPRIAVSGNVAVATWSRWDDPNFRNVIQVARSVDGGATWSQPADLAQTGLGAAAPQVAVSGSAAVIAWSRAIGPNYVVQAARSVDGGATWDQPADLSQSGQNALAPQVAISGNAAVVAWARSDGANTITQSSSFIVSGGGGGGGGGGGNGGGGGGSSSVSTSQATPTPAPTAAPPVIAPADTTGTPTVTPVVSGPAKAQVGFAAGSSALSRAAKARLDALVKRAKVEAKSGARTVTVVGTAAGNRVLAKQRAETVAAYLRARGLTGTYAVTGKVGGTGRQLVTVTVTVTYGR